ncbi:Z1 domain-containing protein [Pseudomonas arsenicoxydans]|uniref:Z1 domain-containing protein n=1 Tax=Pseudomonas arsenicoxydans TaxID=702115 RepID=A0A1H0SLY1_9PSED|nr:Z1 domain-containing protein [Pseudomonas arsenicoxydans]SDP42156.1 Z1 domain-containing protein [Pseudomonas arsenicoxydans]
MNAHSKNVISSNARRLELGVITTLTVDGIPTESEILDLAGMLRKIPNYSVTDAEFQEVIKRLHLSLTLDMGVGNCVYDEHNPWLRARKAEIEPFYWSRYQTDLLKQGWGPKVVNSLDKVTDEILDLMGDPHGRSGWPRRGLVMGDVQSGKTSNYTGLICKAADSGYKLVILLTGTLESLRRQTQERLDAGFVGLDSSGVVNNRKRHRKEIGVGLIDATRSAGVFTSTVGDFKADTVNQLGFKLKDYKEPVLLVVKKNKRILENLATWLINFNAGSADSIDIPLLLIDDEADNASINTNPKKATAINAGIRGLLKVFPRSSYVGFTATPFANVFINPDTTSDMEGDDLFPRDFIYALDAPTNYVGARRIFGEGASLNCLEEINDAEEFFPKGQKSDSFISGLPSSMLDALRCFIIVNAIMDLRSQMPKHRSMLVNVSHFTLIQNQIRDALDHELRVIQGDIQNYASLSITDAMRNNSIRELFNTFEKFYSNLGIEWSELQYVLAAAALPIQVSAVNQKSGPASLDYTAYKEHGLRVVAVGGNSLARGLTLEGLCVSYFYRGTQMYDALLQMGRWFGYRVGYEDLCKIWMSNETADWYSHISAATDELRDEVRRMQVSRLKPIDFGLRVRSHPESLMITARNKMRDSDEIVETISITQESLESARLLKDAHVLLANYKSAKDLLRKLLATDITRNPSYGFPVWNKVPKKIIIEFLRLFVSHPLSIKLQTSSLAEFIERSSDSKLAYWDVGVPSGRGAALTIAPGLSVIQRERTILLEDDTRSLLVNGRKLRVGSSADETIGLTENEIKSAKEKFWANASNDNKITVPGKSYTEIRPSPLLLIHFIEPSIAGDKYELPSECESLVAIGLSFPALSGATHRISYRINLVELRNILSGQASGSDAIDEDDEDVD